MEENLKEEEKKTSDNGGGEDVKAAGGSVIESVTDIISSSASAVKEAVLSTVEILPSPKSNDNNFDDYENADPASSPTMESVGAAVQHVINNSNITEAATNAPEAEEVSILMNSIVRD